MKQNKILSILILALLAVVAILLYLWLDGKIGKTTSRLTPVGTYKYQASEPELDIQPGLDSREGIAYRVNIVDSQIVWSGSKVLGDPLVGTVGIKQGELIVGEDDKLIWARVVVNMNDLHNTSLGSPEARAQLEEHLKNQDFFNVNAYPTAVFELKDFVYQSAAGNSITAVLTGDLTIMSKTRPISFPAELFLTDDTVEVLAQITIDRTDWGVEYASNKFFQNLGDKAIKDDIIFQINIKAARL